MIGKYIGVKQWICHSEGSYSMSQVIDIDGTDGIVRSYYYSGCANGIAIYTTQCYNTIISGVAWLS